MADETDFDDMEVIGDQEDDEKLKELQVALLERCDSADISAEIEESFDEETIVSIEMPNGKETRQIYVGSIAALEDILALDFEKYTFLGDFLAIANYSDHYIEAIIQPLVPMPRVVLMRRLFGNSGKAGDILSIALGEEHSSGDVEIQIGNISKVMGCLIVRPTNSLSIKISGIGISRHDKSLAVLKKITDSLFFQLDLQDGTALALTRDRRSFHRPLSKRRRPNKNGVSLEFPKIEFDDGPSSLYWYGAGAEGMPLLQFLAFYQVIEYYFPTYSQEEARRRIRMIFKNPTFRIDKDADIGKVLSTISGRGGGLGNERSQLRATIDACIDADELREFLTGSKAREKFFKSKQSGLTENTIPIAKINADLRSSVAEVIYDIRCKIVHTKGESSEGEVELLLPFSKEAKLLFHDIELMKFVAQRVLIAASVPMSL